MVLLTALAVGVAAKYSADGASSSPGPPCFDTDGKVCLDLLPLEREERSLLEAPICTVTYYDGDPDAVAEYLRRRVREVVKANPWLGGRLHRSEEDGQVRLWYDPEAEDVPPGLLKEFSTEDIFVAPAMPYKRLLVALEGKGASVGQNIDIVGTDSSVWRVSIVPDGVMRGKKFLLVVSMSHMAGDGHTYYKILRMLTGGGNVDVEAMNPARREDFDDVATSAMGEEGATYLPRPGDKPATTMWDAITRERAHNIICTVSRKWLEEQKREAAERRRPARGDGSDGPAGEEDEPAAAVASTDDVLVSWFFRLASADVGFRVCNFRGRLGGGSVEGDDEGRGAQWPSDLDAGNYSRPVPHGAADFMDPRSLRRSVITAGGMRRAGALDGGDDGTGGGDRGEEGGAAAAATATAWVRALPEFSWENRHAIAADWRSCLRSAGGGTGLGNLDGTARPGRHLPLYEAGEMSSPPGVSCIFLFSAEGGGGRSTTTTTATTEEEEGKVSSAGRGEEKEDETVGLYIIGPKSVAAAVESSDAVEEVVAKF